MKKVNFLIISIVCAIVFSSCSFFTTSLGKGIARDPSEMLGNASTSDLIDLATNPTSSNGEVAAGVLNELANRTDELDDLSVEDREAILALAVDATIPMSALTGVLDGLDIANVKPGDVDAIVDSVFAEVGDFDTGALDAILSNPDTLNNADPSTLADAAIVSLVQVLGKEGVDNIMTNGVGSITTSSTVDQVVAAIAPSTATDAEKAELATTAKVVQLLLTGKTEGATMTQEERDSAKIFGFLTLGDLNFN